MYYHVHRFVARVWFGHMHTYAVNQKREQDVWSSVVRFRSALPCKSFGSPGLELEYSLWIVMCSKPLAKIQSQTTVAHKDHENFQGVGEDMLC